MQCHTTTDNGFFLAQSYFIPARAEEPEFQEQPQDNEHVIQYREEVKNYLPGERLLIQLDKDRRKKKKENRNKPNEALDLERLTNAINKISNSLIN